MVGDISLVSNLNPEIPLTLFKPKHPLGQVVSMFLQRIVNNIDVGLYSVHCGVSNIAGEYCKYISDQFVSQGVDPVVSSANAPCCVAHRGLELKPSVGEFSIHA